MLRHSVLCLDRVFYAATKLGQDQEFLCRARQITLCRNKFGQGEDKLCHDKVWPCKEFLCRDRIFSRRDRVWP